MEVTFKNYCSRIPPQMTLTPVSFYQKSGSCSREERVREAGVVSLPSEFRVQLFCWRAAKSHSLSTQQEDTTKHWIPQITAWWGGDLQMGWRRLNASLYILHCPPQRHSRMCEQGYALRVFVGGQHKASKRPNILCQFCLLSWMHVETPFHECCCHRSNS